MNISQHLRQISNLRQNEIPVRQLGADNAPLQHNAGPCHVRMCFKIEQSQLEKTKLKQHNMQAPYGSTFVHNSNQHHPQIRTEVALATSSQATVASTDSAV